MAHGAEDPLRSALCPMLISEDIMQTDIEKEYLIKAIDATKRKLFIISPEFTILAANNFTKEILKADLSGQKCYKLLYDKLQAYTMKFKDKEDSEDEG